MGGEWVAAVEELRGGGRDRKVMVCHSLRNFREVRHMARRRNQNQSALPDRRSGIAAKKAAQGR